MLFGLGVELLFAQHGQDLHLLHDLAHVLYGVDHIAGAGLSLGADHGCAFGDAPQRLAQVARAADERNLEGVLVDVVGFVGRGEDFGLVDVVDAEFLQNLRLGEVTDAALGHHRDGDGCHDLANLFGRGHAGHAALRANLRGHALERHHRDRAGTSRQSRPAWHR